MPFDQEMVDVKIRQKDRRGQPTAAAADYQNLYVLYWHTDEHAPMQIVDRSGKGAGGAEGLSR